MENIKNCLRIIILGLLVFGCENNIKDEIEARLNGKWIGYIEITQNIPIDQLPTDYINQFPDLYVNEETGMVELKTKYNIELEFNNGQYEYINNSKGTYITNNGKITMKKTYVCIIKVVFEGGIMVPEIKWYSRNELKTVPKSDLMIGENEYYSNEEINNMFSTKIYDYSFNGNSLVLNFNGEMITLNKE